MQPTTRSLTYLASTFLLGLLVGAAAFAYFGSRPPGGPPDGAQGAGPGGFVSHMEATIQPRDEAQRRAILPVLETTDRRNRAVIDSSQRAMRENLVVMRSELDSLLDAGQRDRLAQLVRQLREDGPPAGGKRPLGGQPPPGQQPPPPR